MGELARESYRVGERVLVTNVEEAGIIERDLGDGQYYVWLDSGETIACGVGGMAPEDRDG